ncbi:hypothetical protein CVT26_013254 [Gymnopilus dilepis]|uniref:DUF4139 domain-containing protein n=1 Tax=Gymnopilus dilepis TaxID=231916 RepID=A0A409VUK4_9AGAR|nr:hypothetical protein CVT26_013254 [Gymnopilus dilepis]
METHAVPYTLTLNSTTESTITAINLYKDRAQITRAYIAKVPEGQTHLTISALPNVVDHESIKVEGRGPAVIQGVTASKVDMQEPPSSSPLLEELKDNKIKIQSALDRCKKAVAVIDGYMDNISIEHLDVSKLGEAMDVYDTTEEKWDNKIHDLEKELERVGDEIVKETERLEAMVPNKKLRTEVGINLVATEAAELRINLVYAVSHASWEPKYDVRVDLQREDVPVKVVYKAAISQQTGEVWQNAPITLETAQPTFGLDVPTLDPRFISHTKPSGRGQGLGVGGAKRHRRILPDEDDLDYIEADATYVTSQGHVNAAFRIPGLTTIPSDDDEHEVTIADLELPAKMSWVGVPRVHPRVHLEAQITNTSEYTLLSGPSNVYVDQSFISRSSVPDVSPGELFACPLGVDPSIRVTYHPEIKKVGETGFYNKSIKHTYSQRITVHNMKPVAVSCLKITDRVPVSQDANITVTILKPALTVSPLPTPQALSGKATIAAPAVNVSEGIIAQWRGAEEAGVDGWVLGREGLFDWVCSLPAHGKANLVLEYEVSTSQKTEIYGL